MLLKSQTTVVLSLYASSVLAIPYDAYPSAATTATDNNDSSNGILDGIESGFQRVWDAVTCMGDCRRTWGWTGNHFGADPWGGVLKAGDPMPYVPDDSESSARANQATTSVIATTTTAAGGFGILDVTTTANDAQTSVIFSVFNVPTLSTYVKCYTFMFNAEMVSTGAPVPHLQHQHPHHHLQLQHHKLRARAQRLSLNLRRLSNNNNNNNPHRLPRPSKHNLQIRTITILLSPPTLGTKVPRQTKQPT